jgi:AraC-like DNA-binding protein
VEAKRLLLEESTKMISLDYVSEKSGFGSLSTFIRVFKESEGITPGRFRDIKILEATKKDKN